MSTKTAIDLSTLGAPDNDSEGYGCYISEKGIQAAPESTGELVVASSEAAGKYQGTMYLDGTTYYIFREYIVNEEGKTVAALFSEFNNDFGYDEGPRTKKIPKNFFEYKIRGEKIDKQSPIKTISYITLTNKKLQFFNVASMGTIDFEVSNNIVALFNCNVLAFIDEEKEYLTFVKNPIFATQTQDDITEHFPLGILSLRSWSPVWLETSANGVVAMTGIRTMRLTKGKVPLDFSVLLSEESVFIYNKNTRKILALRQIKRHTKTDYIDHMKANQTAIVEWKAIGWITLPSGSSLSNIFNLKSEGNVFVNIEYNNYLYVFNEENTESFTVSDGGNIYGIRFEGTNNSEQTIISRNEIKNIIGDTWAEDISFFHRLPNTTGYKIKNDEEYRIHYCLSFPALIGGDIDAAKFEAGLAVLNNETEIYGMEANCFFRVKTEVEGLLLTRYDNIDSVIYGIQRKLNLDMITTPDNWTRITTDGKFTSMAATSNAKETFMMSSATMVYEINEDASIVGTSLSYHRQDYLWGQRSRAFSLGTKVYANANPYTKTNKTLEAELKKWGKQDLIGITRKQIPASAGSLAESELAFKTLKIRDASRNLIILSLPEQPTEEKTAEYANAVYYTDIGSFNITPANNQYEVPSNISDKIIGLWGEDRDILFISSKSIERFNIADSIEVPLTFVRLEKTYDLLIDWSGINKRLDLLTKEKGAICLNGEKRVNAIFNENSRIAPDTVWKTTDLRVIENTDCYYAIDSQNRAFKQDIEAPIFSLTNAVGTKPLLAGNGNIFYCDWESSKIFKVAWTYRNERNILLSEITIRMAQFNSAMAEKKREIVLYKDNKRINAMKTANSTVKFYKIGRGLSCRFMIETEGYLKEVVLTDTEGWQK